MLRGRWRKILVGFLVAVPLLGLLGWYVLLPVWVRGGGVTSDIEKSLGDTLGLVVRVGAVEGSVTSGLVLRNLQGVDAASGRRVMDVQEVRLEYDASELSKGRVRSVVLVGPRIEVEHETKAGWSWALLNRAGASGPVTLPLSIDSARVEKLSVVVHGRDVVGRLWDVSADLGSIRLGQPVKARLAGPARAGVVPEVDYNLDPAAIEAGGFTVGCEELEVDPFAATPKADVRGMELAVGNLAAIAPALPLLSLTEVRLESGPVRARLDAGLVDGVVRFDARMELPALRVREGEGPWYEIGQKTAATGRIVLEPREVQLERCRVASEKYGEWQVEGGGSLRT